VEAGEAFQPVQRAGGFESGGVQLQRGVGGVAAGAAAGVLLELRRVRRAVGAQEEARAAAGGRPHQRLCCRMPPVKMALRLYSRWCAVMVAAVKRSAA